MRPAWRWAAFLVAVSCPPAFSQAPEGLIPPLVNPFGLRFMALIGDRSLSARLVVSTVSGEGAFAMTRTFGMPVVIKHGCCRTSVELKSLPGLTAEQRADLKKQRMEQLVVIGLTKERRAYFVYPDLRAYVELPADDLGTVVDSTDFGADKVDGRQCVKKQVVVARSNGAKESWTVWRAEGAEGLPVQIRMTEGRAAMVGSKVVTLRFESVDTSARSDEGLFLPPDGYRHFGSILAFTNWVTETIEPPVR